MNVLYFNRNCSQLSIAHFKKNRTRTLCLSTRHIGRKKNIIYLFEISFDSKCVVIQKKYILV